MQEITQLISTVGFPIVMCLLMYKQNTDTTNKQDERFQTLQKVIENNTSVLHALAAEIAKMNGSN